MRTQWRSSDPMADDGSERRQTPPHADRHDRSMPNDPAAQPAADAGLGPPLLYRVEQVAKLLGLSRATVYELLLKGEIRSLKIGAARRVPAAAVTEFIERRLAD